MKKWLSFVIIFSVLLLSGCSLLMQTAQTSKPGQTKPQAKKTEPLEPWQKIKPEDFRAATTPEGMVKEGPGKYAGYDYDAAALQSELAKLPNGLSTDQLYNRLIYYLAENYKPIVDKLDHFDTSFEIRNKAPDDLRVQAPDAKKLNVAILLDASGSMAGKIDGKTKMEQAKEAIGRFASQLPDGTTVSLRVYGHKGTNQAKDKAMSCNSSEVVYPSGTYDAARFQQALGRFRPAGWTPLAKAIRDAQSDLAAHNGPNTENIVYIVSDGIETCGGDPVAAAQSLHQSNIQAVVNIIGFDVDNAGQKALQAVADAGGGEYSTAKDQQDLEMYLEEQYTQMWLAWNDWGNTNWLDVNDQYNAKWQRLELIAGYAGSQFDNKLQTERKHLDSALEFLDRKNKLQDGQYSELSNKIIDRYNALESYRQQRYDKLDQILTEKRDKLQAFIEQKQQEMQKKYE
ncbi:VWA domain-containing protein [Polycladomyces sp. WAk]|uniref:VWA domain-containing protein n=1 Tax=Polycladomyces zharkentensis TaxID=2807616 RepID=A0ABS2WHF1_9BACL|nr:VWA domain-containing protein [Polycladomyces sp. WAk]